LLNAVRATEIEVIANSIFRTHALVHQLPLVKHGAFEDEQEHRITIIEHFGSRTLMQRTALTTLGQPFSDFAHKEHWIRSMCNSAPAIRRCSGRTSHFHSITPPLWKW
jgi:hypothetical protein